MAKSRDSTAKLQRLRRQIRVALGESPRGLSRPFDAAAVRRIEAAARQRRQLRKEIAVGLEQARLGLVGPFSAAEIKREGRKRSRTRKKG